MQAAAVQPPWPSAASSVTPPWPVASWPSAAGAWPAQSDAPRSLAGGFHSVSLVAAPAIQPRAPVPLRNSFDALREEDENGRARTMPTLADYIVEEIQKRPSKPSKKRRGKGTTFSTGSSTGNFVAELTLSTTSDAPTAPHNIVVSHNSISTHMHATTCDKFDLYDYFEIFHVEKM